MAIYFLYMTFASQKKDERMNFSPVSKIISNSQCFFKPLDDLGDVMPQKPIDLSFLRPNIKPAQDEFIYEATEQVVDNYKPSILGVKAMGLRDAFEYGVSQNVPNGTFQGKEFDEYVQKLNLNI